MSSSQPAGERSLPASSSYFGTRALLVRERPGFDGALLAATGVAIRQFRGGLILNRFSNDRGRFLLVTMLLHLHFDGDPPEAPGGFTVGQVKTLCQQQNICSPGRAGALLAGLQLIGLLTRRPSADRRITRLAPTPHFIDLYRQRWQSSFASLQPVVPWSETVLEALPQDAFIGAMACGLARHFLAGFRPLDVAPVLRPMAERDAGLIIVFSLLHARLGLEDGDAMTVAELARRFAVSRGHVLSLLRTGEEIGLVTRDEAGGIYRATDSLEQALRDFFSNAFVLLGEASREALRQTAGLPGIPDFDAGQITGDPLWDDGGA